MEVLTTSQLEALCKYLSEATYIYYPVATSFFHDLYVTGCRPEELLRQDLWTYIDATTTTLQPLKGNATRTFNSSILSPSLIFAIQNNIAPYDGLTYRQLKAVLYKLIPALKPQTEFKTAIDYMFRYNRVKQYDAEGKTLSEIQTLFGWSSTAFASLYLSQTLYISSEVPYWIYNRITDDADNYLTDADGTIITYP